MLRLDGQPPLDPCPIFDGDLPSPGTTETDPSVAKLYIIGHPLGGELSFSIQDNKLLDHEGPPSGMPSQPGRFCPLSDPHGTGQLGQPRLRPGWLARGRPPPCGRRLYAPPQRQAWHVPRQRRHLDRLHSTYAGDAKISAVSAD